ncbi:MAG TPA: hypothetical protein VGL02_16935 [Streptomyces sp.]
METIGKSKLTDAEMLERLAHGVAPADIAAEAGLSATWTYRRLKRAGADVGHPPLAPLPVPAAQLAREYVEGASIQGLVERHGGGLYYKRVREALIAEGVALRPSTRSPDYPRA